MFFSGKVHTAHYKAAVVSMGDVLAAKKASCDDKSLIDDNDVHQEESLFSTDIGGLKERNDQTKMKHQGSSSKDEAAYAEKARKKADKEAKMLREKKNYQEDDEKGARLQKLQDEKLQK